MGTLYKARLLDVGVDFDPSTATVKKLKFDTPDGVLERTATVTTEGSGDGQQWFLTYTVLAADIAAGLHAKKGQYRIQGYIAFADGQKYHTTISEYVVAANLS
ncbi:MAG: hypothetical protein AB7Q29_13545 [Vicinamibacterales bacterium]